jgi:hypothetical protein
VPSWALLQAGVVAVVPRPVIMPLVRGELVGLFGPGGQAVLLPVPPLGHRPQPVRLLHGPCWPGHSLLLYTDGLVERPHEHIDVSLRLTRITASAIAEAADLLDLVFAEVAPDGPEDDIVAARPKRRCPE